MRDPLENLLVTVTDEPPSTALLRAIDAAKGLSEPEREKLRRVATTVIRSAYDFGVKAAAERCDKWLLTYIGLPGQVPHPFAIVAARELTATIRSMHLFKPPKL